MTAFTFTGAHITDLIFELNEEELFNDVLAIIGEAGAEELIRGRDEVSSIPKYGRRSMRFNSPIGASNEVVEGLVSDALDRFTEPVPNVTMVVVGSTDELIEQILTRKMSDKITVQLPVMFLDQDFVIDGVNVDIDEDEVLVAHFQLTGLRANE
jgi:hypothetical protein